MLSILNNIATFLTSFQIKSVPLGKSSEICFMSVSPSEKNLSSTAPDLGMENATPDFQAECWAGAAATDLLSLSLPVWNV